MIEINIKTLLKNSGILVISNASLKVISFFLLPFYTNELPPEAYGITDTIINASTLMASLFSLCLDWGMNTYFYEENSEDYYKKVTSSGMLFFSLSAIICTTCIFFSKQISFILFRDIDYKFAVLLGILIASIHLFYFPQRVNVRMRGRLKMVGIFSIVELSVILLCNIVFILIFHLGYISIILSNFISQAITMVLYTIDAHKYISVKSVDMALLKKMLFYSIPITPTLLFDWINTFLDRYFVGHYFSQTAVGLYGIGTRMVGMLSVLTGSFLSAYSSFAYANAKNDESRNQYNLVFDFMVVILCLIAVFVTLFSKEIVQFMTAQSYHSSYTVVGILLFAHIIHVLGLIVGYGITIRKKGGLYLIISGCGALANIILNFFLVPQYSFLGAAVATLITEMIIFCLSYYNSQKLFDCGYNLKKVVICISFSLLLAYFSINNIIPVKIMIYIGSFMFILCLYKNRIEYLKDIVCDFARKRKE